MTALVALTACTGPAEPPGPGPASASPADPPVVRVAFVEDRRDTEAIARSAIALQAVTLAFSNAENGEDGLPVSVEVVGVDTGGDPGRTADAAATIAADPTIVAAIAAPGLGSQVILGDALETAGVPWLSLSTLGGDPEGRGWTAWRHLVARQRAQSAALLELARDQPGAAGGFCVAGDGTPASRSLLHPVAQGLGQDVLLRATVAEGQVSVAEAASRMEATGCGVVLWGGEGGLGAALRRQLEEVGLGGTAFVGGDHLRDQGYLDAVGSDGEGTLATCPCVDLSLSTELAAQRFIQDYQSEFGLPPGPYAVEAWDAARILVGALREGAATRDALSVALAALRSYAGLARTYRFDATGALVAGPGDVLVYAVEGGRWLGVAASA